MNPLYLASGSPRRRELLTQIGVPFTVVSAPIDESPLPDESAPAYVERLARAKAAAGLARVEGPAVVLGADTAVVLDGRILGKPENREDAMAMLADLSGREHQVLTAVALAWPLPDTRAPLLRLSRSTVRFAPIGPERIAAYVASGEPMGKAGAYAIQSGAAAWIEHIAGSYSGIMGLPLFETAGLLREAGATV